MVTIPPSTGNFSIPWAVDGTARIAEIPGLPIMPLYGDGDLITIKFIQAVVECSLLPTITEGVKGKAILCGVGAAHIPRSDGVPVSVATVSPKDSELLGKLEEAGNAAYQVGSSERSRCHSI
ncbi:hypothetical protein Tco_0282345 [Tanacetum coccineum]